MYDKVREKRTVRTGDRKHEEKLGNSTHEGIEERDYGKQSINEERRPSRRGKNKEEEVGRRKRKKIEENMEEEENCKNIGISKNRKEETRKNKRKIRE